MKGFFATGADTISGAGGELHRLDSRWRRLGQDRRVAEGVGGRLDMGGARGKVERADEEIGHRHQQMNPGHEHEAHRLDPSQPERHHTEDHQHCTRHESRPSKAPRAGKSERALGKISDHPRHRAVEGGEHGPDEEEEKEGAEGNRGQHHGLPGIPPGAGFDAVEGDVQMRRIAEEGAAQPGAGLNPIPRQPDLDVVATA